MGERIIMNEKNIYIPSLIISIASILLGFFGFCAESVVTGVIALILAAKKSKTHFTKASIVIAVVSILISAIFLTFLIVTSANQNAASTNYWLIQLIFGKME